MSDFESNYDVDKKVLHYQIKLDLWQTAFGLQKVDNLTPSQYMVELATQNIQDKKTYDEVYNEITSYYSSGNANESTKEADIVSLRIVELLADNYFSLSPATLKGIHRHLFSDVFPKEFMPGRFRTVNITKDEVVLDGDTVQYSSHFLIQDALEYDFDKEKAIVYENLNSEERIKRLTEFIADIWQIHPFREGNTRTIAVFAIKYLRQLGFDVDNSLFREHSQYFRDALVLHAYHKEKHDTEPLRAFFDKLLTNKEIELVDLRKLAKPNLEIDDLSR
ncbi:Fic family protein [Aerococcaceae bacterium NML160702]|nr:Fic family protein [Aerococcaceae bacterium NML180378]MCW6682207.1 Fic family protein [Aerococcaceae bacterium NML160702]